MLLKIIKGKKKVQALKTCTSNKITTKTYACCDFIYS